MNNKSACSNFECPLRQECERAVPPSKDLQWYTYFEYRVESNGKDHEIICDHQIVKKKGA